MALELSADGGASDRERAYIEALAKRYSEIVPEDRVDAVYLDYGTPQARRIKRVGATALTSDQFASGSMRPKVEAAKTFVAATGHAAAIGRLEDAAAIIRGHAGTRIEAGGAEIEIRP
jgi:carbamate kinase